MDNASSLPDDIDALKRLVVSRDEIISKLMSEIARLRRWNWGRSAERFEGTLAQLQPALDDLLGDGKKADTPDTPEEPVPAAEDSTQEAPKQNVVPLRR